jgi:hypothetical protein
MVAGQTVDMGSSSVRRTLMALRYPGTETLSQETNAVFPAQTFTATSQTGAVIQFGQNGGAGGSYTFGNISVTGHL